MMIHLIYIAMKQIFVKLIVYQTIHALIYPYIVIHLAILTQPHIQATVMYRVITTVPMAVMKHGTKVHQPMHLQ